MQVQGGHAQIFVHATDTKQHMQRTWKYDPEMYMRRRICNYYALATGRKRAKNANASLKVYARTKCI